MSKAKFTYDESGATFFYFVLSFLALILIPSTYYLWPSEPQEDTSKTECGCNGCKNKRQHLGNLYKWRKSRQRFTRGLIVIGWLAFMLVAYKCATIQHEYVNWDPFEILGVREDASANEIKKAYRTLSLIYHPDKDGGDSDKFVKITKAYAALTNDAARKNWELYGNPDGPGATSFGIALPSWIVEKENSFVVLGIYALIFMVALPVSVGIWWYRSVKYGNDKVLLTTTELYYYFIHKTPTMNLKRVIMILASSLEFAKTHNPEVIERESDNVEVPRIIRDLPLLGEKNKEKPLCYSYSIKARAILHAHLSRMKLPPSTLEVDRCFIVRKCPYLLQEYVNCISSLITLALAGRIKKMPNLSTLENAMKLGPLIIQGLWEYQSPLLQLPHFTDDTLRHLERRKVKLRSIEQLARMKEIDRRDALKIFNDFQYNDLKLVISSMPLVQIESKFEVLDDEEPSVITSGSIVTATVTLKRRQLKDFFEQESSLPTSATNHVDSSQGDTLTSSEAEQGQVSERESEVDDSNNDNKNTNNTSNGNNIIGNNPKNKKGDKSQQKTTSSDDDEEDWDRKFQERILKKQKVFESKPRKSHSVHCPFFPDDKQEFWWVYIVDRKRFALITAPLLVTSLVDTEEIELKFTAPKHGVYNYTIVVRSDSYVDCTVQKYVRVEIKPARDYVELDYDIPDDEIEGNAEGEHSSVEDSDLLTDSDDE